MEKKYKRSSFVERVKIQTLLGKKKSKNYIAITLNRSRTTINNEVKKWIQQPTDIQNGKTF